jgi:hypothetical protein
MLTSDIAPTCGEAYVANNDITGMVPGGVVSRRDRGSLLFKGTNHLTKLSMCSFTTGSSTAVYWSLPANRPSAGSHDWSRDVENVCTSPWQFS